MSFIHYMLVGHFDFRTYRPLGRVPLRPIDFVRARRMLGEVGELVGEDEYIVGGERVYLADGYCYVNGYCRSPEQFCSTGKNSEEFARALAEV